MKFLRIICLLLCSLWLILACKPPEIDSKPEIKTSSKIQLAYKEVDSLVAVFKSEAKLRNKTVSFEGITIRFNNLSTRGFWGYANPDGSIELDSLIWYDLGMVNKEWLLFHELGHAVLKREHFNRTNSNDEFYSVMFDGQAYGYGSIYYGGFRRKYYIDELFTVNTAEPEWFKLPVYLLSGKEKKLVLKEEFIDNKNNWDLAVVKILDQKLQLGAKKGINFPIKINTNEDFEIEFECKSQLASSSFGFYFGETSRSLVFRIDLNPQNSYIFYPSNIFSTNTKLSNFNPSGFNKITLRKIGNVLEYYINERYVFHFDALITTNQNPVLLYTNDNDLEIDNITYSLIK